MFRLGKTALWVVAAVAFAALASEPISVRCQLVIGVACLLMMGAVRGLRLRGRWRQVFIAIGVGLVVRYFFWRTVNTLPPVSDLANFIPGVLLYIAEVYSAIMLAISLFVIADPLERQPQPVRNDADLPTVDVYIPTYNEDPELLAMTDAVSTP